ncbi:hypothetical protein NS230_05775 [Methylobacterium indicum]|nr:hypothetical protein NS230_05775 [Methylobacterium indicum]
MTTTGPLTSTPFLAAPALRDGAGGSPAPAGRPSGEPASSSAAAVVELSSAAKAVPYPHLTLPTKEEVAVSGAV